MGKTLKRSRGATKTPIYAKTRDVKSCVAGETLTEAGATRLRLAPEGLNRIENTPQ
jgi:hypothetical protein